MTSHKDSRKDPDPRPEDDDKIDHGPWHHGTMANGEWRMAMRLITLIIRIAAAKISPRLR